MKLYYNPPSPYARKVLVVAHEKDLLGRLVLIPVDPWKSPPELLTVTPLAKVPALLAEDGVLIVESTLICEYLEQLDGGRPLNPGHRFETMARTALAHGIIDASFATVIERRRPQVRQWAAWIERQYDAIERTLWRVKPQAGRFDLGDITLACALAYLDFRLPELEWRAEHPGLAEWLDEANRRASMRATAPSS
jgi:glutathione S-transferase